MTVEVMYQHQHRAERPTSSSEEDRQAYQNSFSATVHRFMVNNVEAFNALSSLGNSELSTSPQPPPNSRYYGDTLPLESAMGVPTKMRGKRLVQILSPGDVVRGHVILKGHVLGVQITSLVASAKVRDLTGLDVRGMVQYENLSDDKTRCEAVMDEMQLDDVVQAVVINKRESHMDLSFRTEHVSKLCPAGFLPKGTCMGYLDGERAVSNAEKPQSPAAFLEDLEDLPGFANPSSSENLKGVLCVGGYDVTPKPSLIRTIQKAEYPKSEYFDSLRKAQRHKWSMDTVAIGVKHFKSGELGQAKKLLNHALDIDPSNVEGLVARGALLSNGGKYKEAIVDFETALTVNHAHRNARKYLVETQVACGKDLEQEGRLEGAVVCYREALADDPTQDTAKTRLEHLSKILQRKAAEKVERERREAAERARLKRLHSIIEEEKEKKEKKKSKATKKTKKSKKPLRKKKKKKGVKRSSKHRRHSTESEESSDSASSLSSPLHGRSKRRIHSRSASSSPYRRRKKTRSRSVSSSPKRRRRRRRRQIRSRSDSSSPYRRRRGTRSRSISSSPHRRRSNTRSRSGSSSPQRRKGRKTRSRSGSSSPPYRRRRRRNRSASSSPPRRGKKTRSRSSSPQRRKRKTRSRSVSFSPQRRRRRRQSVSRSASSSPHHGRLSVQERRGKNRRTRSRSATPSCHTKTLSPPPHSLHGSAQLVETGQFSRHGLRSPLAYSRSRLKSAAEEGEKYFCSKLRSPAARVAGGNASQSRPARSPPPQGVGKYPLHSPVGGEMAKLSRPRLH